MNKMNNRNRRFKKGPRKVAKKKINEFIMIFTYYLMLEDHNIK